MKPQAVVHPVSSSFTRSLVLEILREARQKELADNSLGGWAIIEHLLFICLFIDGYWSHFLVIISLLHAIVAAEINNL